MNAENIRKVRDVIAGLDPWRFDMREWDTSSPLFGYNGANLVHDCGSCGCIGGWTAALLGDGSNRDNAEETGSLLGLSHDEALALFYPERGLHSSWGSMWDWGNIKTAQAVAVLDHLLATGEVDWSVIGEYRP